MLPIIISNFLYGENTSYKSNMKYNAFYTGLLCYMINNSSCDEFVNNKLSYIAKSIGFGIATSIVNDVCVFVLEASKNNDSVNDTDYFIHKMACSAAILTSVANAQMSK